MLNAVKYGSVALLFVLCSAAIYYLLLAMAGSRMTSRRLTPGRDRRISGGPERRRMLLVVRFVDRHLTRLLRSAYLNLTAGSLVILSVCMGSVGAMAGLLYFASAKGVIIIGTLSLAGPYIWLRSRLVSMQMKSRIDLLPAAESFYQTYVLSESKNIRSVLRQLLDGEQLPSAVRRAFEQLHGDLMVHRNREDSLRIFATSLGGRWAEQMVAMLRYGIEDGADLSDGLRELIADMRRALLNDQAERNRLLEIRIANFSPMLFLVVFLFVNFRLNYEQAYQYYVLSETGKNMLLDALLLIGASFGMGLYLSMRRI